MPKPIIPVILTVADWNAKKGVITVDGKMVERLHLVMAKRVVTIFDAISNKSRIEEPWF